MSRKKIAAATMTLAALGLGFVSYVQVTRANPNREDRDFQAGEMSFPGHRAYLANHQAGHGSSMSTWAHPEDQAYSGSAEPYIGQCYYNPSEPDARTDAAESKYGGSAESPYPVTGGHGAIYGGDGDSRWSSNFSVGGGGFGNVGFGGGGGGGKKHHDNSSDNPPQQPGSNDPPNGSNDTHEGHPQGGDTTPPGNGEPKAGDPPPPNNGDQTQHSDDSPPGPGSGDPKPGEPPAANEGGDGHDPSGPPTNPDPPSQNDGTPPQTEQPPETHAVPEPGTLGLLAFGMAAAALRRRRRN
jgi:hypothetical protein